MSLFTKNPLSAISRPNPISNMNGNSEEISDQPVIKKVKTDGDIENKATDDINFRVITNNGVPAFMESLISLKNIISRQLPKMPKEYIVRLVFDPRHYSMVICKGEKVIGGITYRPYFEQRFAEIAFCAISGTEQVKGFGTLLMNNLKHHVQKQRIEYFLTYADNYALGYFQKQGFVKNVTMSKDRWVGFIKDYDGGTLMECYIHPGIDYLQISSILSKQKTFIYHAYTLLGHQCTPQGGVELFKQGKRLLSPMDIPGVQEAGWTHQRLYKGTTERDRHSAITKLSMQFKAFLDKLKGSSLYKQWKHESKECYEIIEKVTSKVKEGDFYRTKDMFIADFQRMVKSVRLSSKSQEVIDSIDTFEKAFMDLLFKELQATTSGSSSGTSHMD